MVYNKEVKRCYELMAQGAKFEKPSELGKKADIVLLFEDSE
jgi:hypothetical protein